MRRPWRPKYGPNGTVGPAKGFTWGEVRCTDGSMPPAKMIPAVVLQAQLLNQMRAHTARRFKVKTSNVKIVVNSWYRSPQFNTRIGGASNSLHLTGKATDIMVWVKRKDGRTIRLSPSIVAFYASESVAQFRNGGIGVYDRAAFTHLDHRLGKARWFG